MMIKILLTYAKEEVFIGQIQEQCTYVIGKKDMKSALVIRSVIETLPTLAKYGKGQFLLEFIETSIIFLIQQRYNFFISNIPIISQNAKNVKDKSLCYLTLSELFSPLDESLVRDKARMVVKHIREELLQKNKPFCVETI